MDHEEEDGRSVIHSTASAPKVPCVVAFSTGESVTNHGGGTGYSVTAKGSCLRSATPRIISKPRAPQDNLSALGRENSVLRYSVEGNRLRTYEVPAHSGFRAVGRHAKRPGKALEHKSRWDIDRARVRALAEARDLSLLFGHNVKFGCTVQWEETTCYTVVPWSLGHDVDDPDPQVEVVDMPRQLGVYLLGDVWNLVGHSGSTPDDDERTIAAEHFAFAGNQCRYSPKHLMPREAISDEELDEADATTTGSLEERPQGAEGFVYIPSCPVRGSPP